MHRIDRRRLMAGSLAAAVLGTARPSLAQLQLDITRGYVEPMPIAISPFAGSARGTELADVIQADLDGSGLFKTIDRQAYIQQPEELRGSPRFGDWRQINAQALITGTVDPGPAGLGIEFRLWDVFAGTQLRGLRYDVADPGWRRVAHKIADVAYERLTGESGYFDTRIAYISEAGSLTRRSKRVVVMDQDGANARALTSGVDLVLTPRIAPDARRVAFMAYRNGPPKVIVKEIDTGREGLLGDLAGMTFAPRFSRDGRTLLYSVAQNGATALYSYDVASRRSARLTGGGAIDTSPDFSPDGAQIVFNSDRGGTPQLYVMARGGGGASRISYGDGRYGSPAWSPRGDLIAFTKVKGGLFSIGIMQPDGSNERLLTRSYMDQGPSWAPNGRVILYARADPASNRSRLRTVDITGYNEREVPTPTDASDPDWSPLIP